MLINVNVIIFFLYVYIIFTLIFTLIFNMLDIFDMLLHLR